MEELTSLDAFHVVNKTLRGYNAPTVEWESFARNPDQALCTAFQRGCERGSSIDFITDIMRGIRTIPGIKGEYATRRLGRGYEQTVRTALERHTPQAQDHFSLYLLRRLFAEYKRSEAILDEDGHFAGAQHSFKPRLVIKSGRIGDGIDWNHFQRVVSFASLDEAIALAQTYESHPPLQGAVLACVADWAHENPTEKESWDDIWEPAHRTIACAAERERYVERIKATYVAKKVAAALQHDAVMYFVKAITDAGLSPVVSLYCLTEIARDHRNIPHALDVAIVSAKNYIAIPAQNPECHIPEVILTYLADVFITWDKEEGHLEIGRIGPPIPGSLSAPVLKPTEDEIADFYEAGYQRVAGAFRLDPVKEITRELIEEKERHTWMRLVVGCALSYDHFQEPLGACKEVFDAYRNTLLFDTAIEMMGEAGQRDHERNGIETKMGESCLRATKTYLLSNQARRVGTLEQSLIDQMFKDPEVNKMYYPLETKRWTDEERMQARRATILYSIGTEISEYKDDAEERISILERLYQRYNR